MTWPTKEPVNNISGETGMIKWKCTVSVFLEPQERGENKGGISKSFWREIKVKSDWVGCKQREKQLLGKYLECKPAHARDLVW